MSERAPHTSPAAWLEPRPGRLAAALRRDSPEGCRCALLGLPDDLGVRLNGGRPGARGGPSHFRAALSRFGVAWDGAHGRALEVAIYDAGDVDIVDGSDESALHETHARVRAAVEHLQARGLITVCVGGGHDLTFPAVSAAAGVRGRPLGGINLDAHLDVRTRVGSGMPFRRLIEGGHIEPRRFAELGLGRFANDPGDLEWLRAQGAALEHVEPILDRGLEVQRWLDFAASSGGAFVSIDLDALDQSVAPGVSAPNPLGLGVRDAARLAEAAGARPEVLHFDLMELNPAHDVDGHTGRVAALLFLHFVAGLTERAS